MKKNNTLKVLATSAFLLMPSTVEAVTVPTAPTTTIDDNIDFNPVLQQKEGFNEIIEETERMIAEKEAAERLRKQIEEERLEKIRQQELLLQQQRDNFFYLVSLNNVTKLDLNTASGLKVEQANLILNGTGLDGLGNAFVEAEKQYEVNAYYLMAHAAWESKWGQSQLAQNKNNLFGFTAYDANPGESATYFSSKAECIHIVAKYVKENYLNPNGKYYNGPHLDGMNIYYATDENWSNGIAGIMKKFVNKAKGNI